MDTADATPERRAPWWERAPSWTFLAILAGLFLVAFLLSWAFPATFWNPPEPAFKLNDDRCPDGGEPLPKGHGFFYDYYWVYILCDEGYNPVNTASWAILLGLMLLWAYRLTVELGERVDVGLILAVVPYLLWGSVYRVLEDSDLFAPYGAVQPAMPKADGFLDQYLGVFFITPIIYVEVTFVAVALLLWAHRARRVALRTTVGDGLRYFAFSLVVLLALYTALWASDPSYIRFVAHPMVAVGAAIPAYWLVHRYASARGEVNPHVALGAYGVFFLLIGIYYVVVWNLGGVDVWRPPTPDPLASQYPLPEGRDINGWPIQWWVLLAMVVAPGLIAYSTWRKGRVLSGRDPRVGTAAEPRKTYGGVVTFLCAILLVEALGVFLTILGMADLAQRQIANAWTEERERYARTLALLLAGPVSIALGTLLSRRLAGRGFRHVALLHYAAPVNLLMVLGQTTDGLMTSLGIDLYHYSEKHVLPRFLIEKVDGLGLADPLGTYPTAIVMIPLKLLIVLLVVVAIDASADRELRERQNLIGLVKLGIIMVGLSPGVRDGVRLAMAI